MKSFTHVEENTFVLKSGINDKNSAVAYLSNKTDSVFRFFSLKWEKRNVEEMVSIQCPGQPFTVKHLNYGWWEISFYKEDKLIKRSFTSMEECIAFITWHWW